MHYAAPYGGGGIIINSVSGSAYYPKRCKSYVIEASHWVKCICNNVIETEILAVCRW